MKIVHNVRKTFSGTEYVHSGWMNYLGLQAFRNIASKGFGRMRDLTRPHDGMINKHFKNHARTLRKNGVLIIENFLPAQHFNAVVNEYQHAIEHAGEQQTICYNEIQGYEIGLSRIIDTLPAIKQFITGQTLQQLFSMAERRNITIKSGCLEYYLANLSPGEHHQDTTTRVHSDIFYDTHKGWLLIDDVTVEHGPIYYAIGSHKLSLKRLAFEYHSGILSYRDAYPNFYYQDNVLNKLETPKLTPITAPKNSLIIANTHGFHRRGIPATGNVRKAIRVSLRYNPFTFDEVWWE